MAPPPPPPHFLLLVILLLLSTSAQSQPPRRPLLTPNYYRQSCPRFEQIVQDTTINKQISSPTTAAAALRLFFHDCFVNGCDASILISSTHLSKSERDADINLSLPGDAFDLIVRAKTALELACPGVVSCADILTLAVRNLLVMMGGPFYSVQFGRRDSLTSKPSDVEHNLPKPSMSMDQIIQIFKSKGFSVEEMVALSLSDSPIVVNSVPFFTTTVALHSPIPLTIPNLQKRFVPHAPTTDKIRHCLFSTMLLHQINLTMCITGMCVKGWGLWRLIMH